MKAGLCTICGGIATYTCKLCASQVCSNDMQDGICKRCLAGKKVRETIRFV